MRYLLFMLLLVAAGCEKPGTSAVVTSDPAPVSATVQTAQEPAPAQTSVEPEPASAQLISNAGTYRITHELADPQRIPLNTPFTFTVQVSPPEQVALQVDAAMPEHHHGMIRMPRVTPLGDGAFQVDGMLLHMAGRWELYFDVTHKGVTERAESEIILE
jgi:hypothetical protein